MLRPEKGGTQPDRLSAGRWLTATWSVQEAKEEGAKEEKELMISPLVSRKKEKKTPNQKPQQYDLWHLLEGISRNSKKLEPPWLN